MRRFLSAICILSFLILPVSAMGDGYSDCGGCGPCNDCRDCGPGPAPVVKHYSPNPDWVFLCTRGDGVEVYATRALQRKLSLREADIRLNPYGLYVITRPSTGFINAKFFRQDLVLERSAPYSLGSDKVEIEIPAPFEQKCNRVLLF
ncbi:MAG: hypothetical protein LLG06_14935 [Desulfobacteraceae bacterium]|nr:hypothetical protein [Desulfobacteraceae bacterium]